MFVLDALRLKTYSSIMSRKYVAAVFVALWFILLGIEFSEDMGFFQRDEPEVEQLEKAALAGLGDAIKVSDGPDATALSVFVLAPLPVDLALPDNVASERMPVEKRRFREDFKLHKLHSIFLI